MLREKRPDLFRIAAVADLEIELRHSSDRRIGQVGRRLRRRWWRRWLLRCRRRYDEARQGNGGDAPVRRGHWFLRNCGCYFAGRYSCSESLPSLFASSRAKFASIE